MSNVAEVKVTKSDKGTKAAKAPRPKVDPETARKAIEAQIAKLKARLESKVTALAVETNPAVAAVEARLAKARKALGASNRILVLNRKGLATMRVALAEAEDKVTSRAMENRELSERVAALEVELETAKAGLTPAQ